MILYLNVWCKRIKIANAIFTGIKLNESSLVTGTEKITRQRLVLSGTSTRGPLKTVEEEVGVPGR